MSALMKVCALASLWSVVLLLSSPTANAQAVLNNIPCFTTLGWMFYNFSVLQGTQMTGVSPLGDYNYYLNLCGVAPACRRDGAMACQISTDGSNTQYGVAFPNDDIAQHYWSPIPGGVSLTAYGDGQWCNSEGYERVAVVDIMCNTTVTGPVTSFAGPVIEGPPCTYTMTVNHISGCGASVVNTTTPAPTPIPSASSSTDQSKVTGAGVGVGIAIGVVLSVLVILVYIYVARRGTGGKWNKFGEDKGLSMGNVGHTSEATNM